MKYKDIKRYLTIDKSEINAYIGLVMKTRNAYIDERKPTEDVDEGGYVVSFPDLPGCLTCGNTVEEAVKYAEDAKRSWLEAAVEDGLEIKEPTEQLSYSGQFKLRLPKSLHKTLAEHAREEGISMNQYCIYLLSKNSI